MRIVHVLHSMEVAGAEVLVHDFVARRAAEVPQAVITLDKIGTLGESLRAKGVEVVCVGRKPGVDVGLPLRIAREIRRLRADVVHAHQYTPYFYSALAVRTAYPRPALIFTEHGRHVPDFRRPKRVVFNQLALRWTDRVTAVCGYVKRLLVANEGIAADRIEVIYNGVDPSRFMAEVDGRPVRAELGVRDDELLVACVARFHPVKDHATLIKGFARAAQKHPKAKLLLVGGGQLEQQSRELCGELGIGDRVIFAGVRKDVPEVLAASDAFAMTSLSEGTSVTLLEAMLSRRPAVVTRVGGNPEIVEEGRTGLLVARGDAEATGEALDQVLASHDRRRSFGAAGRDRALDLFSQDRMHRAWLGAYRDASHRLAAAPVAR